MGAFDISEDFIALTLVAMQPKVLVEEVKELIAHTDPEVPWVGLTEDQAKAQGIKVKKGLFPWAACGRAIANGRDEGVTKLLFDDSPEAHGHGKILGGGIGMAAEVAHGSCMDLPAGAKVGSSGLYGLPHDVPAHGVAAFYSTLGMNRETALTLLTQHKAQLQCQFGVDG